MGKQLSAKEIADLVAGVGKRGGRKSDSSEPRTTENWWKQIHHLLYRPDNPELDIKCSNSECADSRPEDKAILLGEVKGTLMCRYCFLNGYLSGE